jgi:hypothetical protein
MSGSVWLPTIHPSCFATSAPRRSTRSIGKHSNSHPPIRPCPRYSVRRSYSLRVCLRVSKRGSKRVNSAMETIACLPVRTASAGYPTRTAVRGMSLRGRERLQKWGPSALTHFGTMPNPRLCRIEILKRSGSSVNPADARRAARLHSAQSGALHRPWRKLSTCHQVV